MANDYACLECGFVEEYNEVRERVDQKAEKARYMRIVGSTGPIPELHGYEIYHECTRCGNQIKQGFKKD